MAAPLRSRIVPPYFSHDHQAGLTNLLSQVYNKPVNLNLIKLKLQHHDADVLAQRVALQLKDRRATPRRVVREGAWKAEMPSNLEITKQRQELLQRKGLQKPLTLANMTMGGKDNSMMSVGDVIKDLALPQVTAVGIKTSGRLGARLTADQSKTKVARRGLTVKGQDHVVRGVEKANKTQGMRSGKRKIGVYGIKVDLGHS
jgi:hypothetical protein